MARHSETYKSQDLVVFVRPKGGECTPWRVVITGAHQRWPIGPHPLKTFPTEADAAAYGLTAARWVVDNPGATSGSALEKQPHP
jgi:hypothetical protein